MKFLGFHFSKNKNKTKQSPQNQTNLLQVFSLPFPLPPFTFFVSVAEPKCNCLCSSEHLFSRKPSPLLANYTSPMRCARLLCTAHRDRVAKLLFPHEVLTDFSRQVIPFVTCVLCSSWGNQVTYVQLWEEGEGRRKNKANHQQFYLKTLWCY